MKKYFVVLSVCALFFLSCNEEITPEESSIQTPQSETVKSEILSPMEAAMLAQREAERLFSVSSRSSFRNVSMENVKVITNIGSRASVQDTLMYVVNFNDETGYAIIGARRDHKNMLALIDKGSYNPETGTDNPGLKFFLGAAESYLTSDSEPEDSIPDNPILDVYPSKEHRDTITNQQVAPKFNGLAWGQTGFYGEYCPNGIAGCVPVAIGTIKTYLRKKYNGTTTESFDFPERPYSSTTINWNEIFAHKNYLNCRESEIETTHTAIAALLRQIGKDANASYNSESTPVTGSNAKNEVVRQFSDQKVSGVTDFNFYTIKTALNTGIVYMQGSVQNSNNGHAWVADGYKHLVIKHSDEIWNPATNRFDKAEPYYSNYLYIHFCWGWNGEDDGWFEGSVFRTSSYTFNNVQFMSICPK